MPKSKSEKKRVEAQTQAEDLPYRAVSQGLAGTRTDVPLKGALGVRFVLKGGGIVEATVRGGQLQIRGETGGLLIAPSVSNVILIEVL